ncbi:MAG: hypothetical protein AUK03_02600 [Anaerolineae bacterium CG2_30_64_16]|nr:MAG: hypothetical protein AUK03_02600 [Anaerolineae bacterium CG2_30_64_16]
MDTTIVVRTNILPDRSVRIRVPESVPLGLADITVVITPEQQSAREPAGTAAELARSPLFGLWADRTDIVDSVTYARELRAQAERRSRD